MLDARGGQTILQVVAEYLNLVMVPALSSGQKWGALTQDRIDDFMLQLRSFTHFLNSECHRV